MKMDHGKTRLLEFIYWALNTLLNLCTYFAIAAASLPCDITKVHLNDISATCTQALVFTSQRSRSVFLIIQQPTTTTTNLVVIILIQNHSPNKLFLFLYRVKELVTATSSFCHCCLCKLWDPLKKCKTCNPYRKKKSECKSTLILLWLNSYTNLQTLGGKKHEQHI